MAINRKQFLGAAGATAAAIPLASYLRPRAGATAAGTAAAPPHFASVEEIYRARFTWDRIVKVSHGRSNCMSACSWDAYVRGGVVWREEQNRVYEAAGPGYPDFNPRGCQKGACYSEQTASPLRLQYPMRRVGPRGGGRWERITWQEAYETIADTIIDACLESKPQKLVYDHGTTNLDFGPDQIWEMRLFTLLGCTELDSWGLVGDEMMGAIQTLGAQNIEGSSDDWFNSDYIVVWMGNPVYTRIPDVHFMTEARYNGAQLVVIAPDYSASATKADLWVPIEPRSDAALALAAAKVMIDEDLYDADYVRHYTDLPLLVDAATGQFLRARDLQGPDAPEHLYYGWDAARQAPVAVPGTWDSGDKSTKLPAGVELALDGRFEVRRHDGTTVAVRTAWNALVARLQDYTPERVQATTGVHPNVTRALARGFGRAKAPMIYSSWGAGKGYHTDLEQRAKILLCALAGSHGKPGGGFRVAAWYTPEAWALVSYSQPENFPEELSVMRRLGEIAEFLNITANATVARGAFNFLPTDPTFMEHVAQKVELGAVPAIPWFYMLEPEWQRSMEADHDTTYPRALKEYAEAALRGAYADNPYMTQAEVPSLYLFTGCNPLRRLWRHEAIERSLWQKIGLVVGAGIQMNYSMHHADIILPVAGWYEKTALKYCSTYVPYLIMNDKAVEPLGECKDEYTISGELARVIAARAQARGHTGYRDPFGTERDLATLYDRWSFNDRFPPTHAGKEAAFEFELKVSAMANPYFLQHWQEHGFGAALDLLGEDEMTLADLRQAGALKMRSTGKYTPINGVAATLKAGKPITPHEWFIERHLPFPTATGRIQFNIDHPWYLEADEALPRHKAPPPAGGDHPFFLSGGHTRWSIHSQWRETKSLLRLQRGEPVVHVSVEDAAALGLQDHDWVEMYNDLGTTRCRVRVAAAMRPGTVCIYHAWQPWHFPGGVSDKALYGSPIKPLHMAGDYPQLDYRLAGAQPGHCPRDTKVSLRRVG